MSGGGRPASRASGATRRALVEAAVESFAEHGFEAASVRDITAKAAVNQGAITYHFGGKEGLYRAVLQAVREAVSSQPLLDAEAVARHAPPEALRRFFRQILAPLAEGPGARRHLRVFAWEQLRPTAVGRRLAEEEPFPPAVLARHIVRRFRPGADEAEVSVAVAWMIGQAVTFLRDADFWSRQPFSLSFDASTVDGLASTLARLCLGGLACPVGGVHLTEI